MNLTEIQIDPVALKFNLSSLKALLGSETQIAAVVKGNAYGHGLELVISLLDGSVDYFQIDDFDELERVRRLTSTPVLVLGYVAPDQLESALRLGCEFGIYDLDYLKKLGQTCRQLNTRVSVHLKIDALLGRLGVLPDQVPALLDGLSLYPELDLIGIYAHFANIEDTTDLTHAQDQLELLNRSLEVCRARGLAPKPHISATSGLMAMGRSGHQAIARIGIGLYGMYPSLSISRTHQELGLRPVLRWLTKLAQVKTLPPRHPIGYGLTYVTAKETTIGIVPVGYSDGFDRGLSNCGEVLVGGKRCAVLGRVAMNMFAIDLSGVESAAAGDPVVLIGGQGDENIWAEEIAARIGTINYEVTSRISSHLPRVQLKKL